MKFGLRLQGSSTTIGSRFGVSCLKLRVAGVPRVHAGAVKMAESYLLSICPGTLAKNSFRSLLRGG